MDVDGHADGDAGGALPPSAGVSAPGEGSTSGSTSLPSKLGTESTVSCSVPDAKEENVEVRVRVRSGRQSDLGSRFASGTSGEVRVRGTSSRALEATYRRDVGEQDVACERREITLGAPHGSWRSLSTDPKFPWPATRGALMMKVLRHAHQRVVHRHVAVPGGIYLGAERWGRGRGVERVSWWWRTNDCYNMDTHFCRDPQSRGALESEPTNNLGRDGLIGVERVQGHVLP